MAQEKTVVRKERAAPPVTVKAVYDNEGMHVRFEKKVFYDLMNNWDIWKRLANEWQAWRELFKTDRNSPKPQLPETAYFIDDGLGFKGECPVHGYAHVQLIPPYKGAEPMMCHKAMKWMEKQNAATGR